ncbi:hypothetical protein LCGC14_0785420 [marine sediment metagenome]|uniref:Uncharacterized protein n=1 Tax=marine sediment metagenome TaxID=412755 RepID=A0A0F9QE24_9ZZZZ
MGLSPSVERSLGGIKREGQVKLPKKHPDFSGWRML